MAIQDIIKEIETDAENKIKEIEKERDETISQINEDNSQKLALKAKEILNEAKIAGRKLVEKAHFEAKGISSDKIIEQKTKAINAVYLGVGEKLNALSSTDYDNLLNNFWSKIVIKNDLEIYIAKSREVDTKNFFKKKGIAVAGVINSSGGFVAKSQELEIDNTFEAIINSYKQETELKIIDILF
jgi:V/A-type H+-transporting ATPase subunit E